jgi:hypothetical protein
MRNTDTFTDYCSFPYSKPDIQHLLRLTDSFTWEEMPTSDPDTGHLTKAGYIPILQNVAAYILTLSMIFHTVYSTVRIVLNHEMPFTNWYPFDLSLSPLYAIAILTQVMFLPQLGTVVGNIETSTTVVNSKRI